MIATLCSKHGYAEVHVVGRLDAPSMHLVATDDRSAQRLRPGAAVVWRDMIPHGVEIVSVSNGAAIARRAN